VTIDHRDIPEHVALSVADVAIDCCIDDDPRNYGTRLDFGAGLGGPDYW